MSIKCSNKEVVNSMIQWMRKRNNLLLRGGGSKEKMEIFLNLKRFVRFLVGKYEFVS